MNPCWLSSVPKNREEMTGRSGDYEEVPDEVAVAQTLRGEERETAGISNAAG